MIREALKNAMSVRNVTYQVINQAMGINNGNLSSYFMDDRGLPFARLIPLLSFFNMRLRVKEDGKVVEYEPDMLQEVVRNALKARGMTVKYASGQVGLTSCNLSSFFSGHSIPVEKLDKLLVLLGISLVLSKEESELQKAFKQSKEKISKQSRNYMVSRLGYFVKEWGGTTFYYDDKTKRSMKLENKYKGVIKCVRGER